MVTCQQCGYENVDGSRFCVRCGGGLEIRIDVDRSAYTTPVAPGTIFENKYQVLEEIGRGGMGVVYRAHDLSLNRMVAIKVLPEQFNTNDDVIARFKKEARAMAALDHPNVVPVYAIGQQRHFHYFVMKFLEGETVAERLEALRKTEVPRFPPQLVRSIVSQACRGLGHAHRRGLIHRDIKPGNIMLSPDEHVTIMDFGIVKEQAGGESLTRTGQVFGTPEYMAPEQAQGQSIPGPSTDLYSLGVVAYEMLSGLPPFRGESPFSVVLKHIKEPPAPLVETLPDVPLALQVDIFRALAKRPEDRWPNADAMREALESADMRAPGGAVAEDGARRIPLAGPKRSATPIPSGPLFGSRPRPSGGIDETPIEADDAPLGHLPPTQTEAEVESPFASPGAHLGSGMTPLPGSSVELPPAREIRLSGDPGAFPAPPGSGPLADLLVSAPPLPVRADTSDSGGRSLDLSGPLSELGLDLLPSGHTPGVHDTVDPLNQTEVVLELDLERAGPRFAASAKARGAKISAAPEPAPRAAPSGGRARVVSVAPPPSGPVPIDRLPSADATQPGVAESRHGSGRPSRPRVTVVSGRSDLHTHEGTGLVDDRPGHYRAPLVAERTPSPGDPVETAKDTSLARWAVPAIVFALALAALLAYVLLKRAADGADLAPESSAPGAEEGPPPNDAKEAVLVRLLSRPSGAEVLERKSGQRIGQTPHRFEQPISATPLEVVLRAPGHADQVVRVPLREDRDLTVDLKPLP